VRNVTKTSGSAALAAGCSAPAESGRSTSLRQAWIARIVFVLAVCISVALLARTLSRYDAAELVGSIRAVPASHLLGALGWAAASYLCLTANDWLALRYVGCPLPWRKAAAASFVALSFGHNIGFAALSSGAIRYRFYAREGIGAGDVARIIVFCGTTIFLGMFTLGSGALLVRPDLAQAMTGLPRSATLLLGAGAALVPALYIAGAFLVRRRLRLWRWSIELPRGPTALMQTAVGTVNFLLVAACLDQTVSAIADVPYLAVLAAFVLANSATIITHTPGGLGVIETVVLTLLGKPDLIGAVLVFRFAYYLVPLCLGAVLFAVVEMRARRRDGAVRHAAA
jgi:uncharacterized membrane protein YbhN (UPF0104 family)